MAAFASTREGALMFYKTVTHEEPQEKFPEPQEGSGYEVYDHLGQKIG
jgi:hypothetical protein